MSKKTNTVLFVLVATVFNVFITVSCFILLLIIYSKYLFPRISEGISPWVMPVLFITSIVVSFLVYRLALKVFMKKVNMEKLFDPVFKPKRPPG